MLQCVDGFTNEFNCANCDIAAYFAACGNKCTLHKLKYTNLMSKTLQDSINSTETDTYEVAQ